MGTSLCLYKLNHEYMIGISEIGSLLTEGYITRLFYNFIF